MSSNMVVTPRFDYFDNTNAKRAGLTLQWADEGGTFTDQKAKVLPMTIRANKAGIFVRVTNEAAEDIPSFERRVQAAMVNAIAAGLDYAILWGTGAGTWLGVLQAPALIVVPKETASPQAPDSLLEINITKMAAALHPSCWRNAIWLCSPSTLAQLFQMSQATGPYQGVRTAMIAQTDQGLRILGKEVVVTDACAIVGDVGDLVLGDFSKYVVGLRREARLETTIHANWQTDELGVRMILRAGAQPEWQSPVKLRTGDEVSCFVALEAR
jgi:HK97 family phage major capsid protein